MTRPIDETHDPDLRSWVETANTEDAEFPIQNLPVGVVRRRGVSELPRVGIAIGDQVLDLVSCRDRGLLQELPPDLVEAVGAPSLNRLMALGHERLTRLRRHVSRLLRADGGRPAASALMAQEDVECLLPADVGDYTDFYASIFHAARVGSLLRPDNPLLPNYKHVPVAYHGRSSSLVASGTPVSRPRGQTKPKDAEGPAFGPSQLLDYEVEVGVFVGRGTDRGRPIFIDEAEDHVFGLCLVNDWSARDIQAWEYQPLGPFLSKSFATTVSPWVVTLEALAPFRCPAFPRPADDPRPLAYLSSARHEESGGMDVTVEVLLRSGRMRREGLEPLRLSVGTFRDMYWTVAQMLTHHTSNGCNLRPGDLVASGTVSGPHDGSQGCLLEITRRGVRSFELPTGEERTFLVDGDEVVLRGYCARDGYRRIGFGECTGVVVAASPSNRP